MKYYAQIRRWHKKNCFPSLLCVSISGVKYVANEMKRTVNNCRDITTSCILWTKHDLKKTTNPPSDFLRKIWKSTLRWKKVFINNKKINAEFKGNNLIKIILMCRTLFACILTSSHDTKRIYLLFSVDVHHIGIANSISETCVCERTTIIHIKLLMDFRLIFFL